MIRQSIEAALDADDRSDEMAVGASRPPYTQDVIPQLAALDLFSTIRPLVDWDVELLGTAQVCEWHGIAARLSGWWNGT